MLPKVNTRVETWAIVVRCSYRIDDRPLFGSVGIGWFRHNIRL